MRILFVIPSFHIGGTNKVLISIIKMLTPEHDCSVFSIKHDEDSLKIKDFATVLPDGYISQGIPLRDALRHADYKTAVMSVLLRLTKRWGRFGAQRLAIRRAVKRLSSMQFDLVIGMEEGFATEVASLIDAPRRLAWIHCDYSRYLLIRGPKDEQDIYTKFNSIVCVSQYTTQVFKEVYPNLAAQVVTLYNPIDVEAILANANEALPDGLKVCMSDSLIVSIGRLDPVKRFDEIPRVSAQLKERGLDFEWYIVGDGEERAKIEQQIRNFQVAEDVKLTGFIANPYPLLKRAKALVMLSESEACPNVIHEAMSLSVPVITTDYPTAYEYIDSPLNGDIVALDNMGDAIEARIAPRADRPYNSDDAIIAKPDFSENYNKIYQLITSGGKR